MAPVQRKLSKLILAVTAIIAVACPVQTARGDGIGQSLLLLLDDFGFQFSGSGSSVRQGFTVTMSRQFNNDEFDFGMVSLALNGPLTFQFEAAQRLGPSAEFAVSTFNQPLSYNFTINTGAQDFTAIGAMLINSSSEINMFGFYDYNLFVSNRGTFETDGFLLVDSGTLDFDIGPIDASGNIFVDALAVVTEPFWVAINQPNPLAKISGRATKEAAIDGLIDGIEKKVEADLALTDADMQALIDATVIASVLGLDVPDLSFLEAANLEELTTTTAEDGSVVFGDNPNALIAVPEPGVALLIIGPTLVWMGRRRWRRASHP